MHLKYYCEHCEKDDNNIFNEREIFDIDGNANFDSDEGRINEPYREYWDYYPKLNPINISNLKFHKIKNHSELIKYFFCKKHNKIFTKYCKRSGKNGCEDCRHFDICDNWIKEEKDYRHPEPIKYFLCQKHNKKFTKYCKRSHKNGCEDCKHCDICTDWKNEELRMRDEELIKNYDYSLDNWIEKVIKKIKTLIFDIFHFKIDDSLIYSIEEEDNFKACIEKLKEIKIGDKLERHEDFKIDIKKKINEYKQLEYKQTKQYYGIVSKGRLVEGLRKEEENLIMSPCKAISQKEIIEKIILFIIDLNALILAYKKSTTQNTYYNSILNDIHQRFYDIINPRECNVLKFPEWFGLYDKKLDVYKLKDSFEFYIQIEKMLNNSYISEGFIKYMAKIKKKPFILAYCETYHTDLDGGGNPHLNKYIRIYDIKKEKFIYSYKIKKIGELTHKLLQLNDDFIFQNYIIKIKYSKDDYPEKIIVKQILDKYSFDSCDYEIFKDSIIYKLDHCILKVKKNKHDKYIIVNKITNEEIEENFYNFYILIDNLNKKILLLYNFNCGNNKIYILNSSLAVKGIKKLNIDFNQYKAINKSFFILCNSFGFFYIYSFKNLEQVCCIKIKKLIIPNSRFIPSYILNFKNETILINSKGDEIRLNNKNFCIKYIKKNKKLEIYNAIEIDKNLYQYCTVSRVTDGIWLIKDFYFSKLFIKKIDNE